MSKDDIEVVSESVDDETFQINTATVAKKRKKDTAVKTDTVTEGDKGKYKYLNPNNVVIIGWDTDAPTEDQHPAVHRCYQPERLRDIKKNKTGDLQASIRSAGEVVVPITVLRLRLEKGADPVDVVAFGRRRTIALRAENEARAASGLPPLLYKAIEADPSDPSLWIKIRSENSSRAADSPLATAADVAKMLEGDEVLGIPAMNYKQIGEVFGRTHQFARDMEKLNNASPKVKDALRKGKLSQTAAVNLAVIPEHDAQEAALDEAIEAAEASGDGKVTTRKASAKANRKGAAKVKRPTKTVSEIRDVLRGLNAEIDEASTKAVREPLQHAALFAAWHLGEEPEDMDEAQEALWLALDNAMEKGAGLAKEDKEAEKEALKAEKLAEREAAKAEKQAAREAAKIEKAAKKAAKKAKAAAKPGKMKQQKLVN